MEAIIIVRDNGPGLPEFVERNLGIEKPSISGMKTGLGLMIASELCRKHGGSLEVVKTGWEGTEFRVVLPFEDSNGSEARTGDGQVALRTG